MPGDLVLRSFEPAFVTACIGARLADSYYETLMMDMTIAEAGLSAEVDSCDAVCIDTVSDSGLTAAALATLHHGVLVPWQVAFHTVCLLGHRSASCEHVGHLVLALSRVVDPSRLLAAAGLDAVGRHPA